MRGYIRPNANDTIPVLVVLYTDEQLIAMGYYPVITAGSAEIIYKYGG